jgi:2-polyprenyl-6-methoxyphenol hydroxylase-like FAD-dependent oxidoreductase
VVVVGAGIGGLTTALALGRAGHRVTVIERDDLPVAASADEAFGFERRGAPQVHQTHGFLARSQVLLRERFPDVFERLLAAGGTTMSTTANLGDAQPGDADLAVLIVRRTTLEWVLRDAARREPGVDLRAGVHAAGLLADTVDSVPVVRGVRLDDGGEIGADVVIDSGGRRSPVVEWLRQAGANVEETIRESGLVYLSRWYRFPAGPQSLADPKLGGDLGFVKFLGVPGDGNTVSVTLAVRSDDAELRRVLLDERRFDLACRLLPGPDRFFVDGPLEPLSGVKPMGGLLNRLRRFVDADGEPVARRIHAVGDAHTCTNPLYGRGCSLAMVQAVLLSDTLAEHDDDRTRAVAYEAACGREVEPWYHASVEMDRAGADPAGFAGAAGGPGGTAIAAVFAAAATDPVIGRATVRFFNLMATPGELFADPVLMARIAEVVAHPEDYPTPPRDGPTRDELVQALSGEQAVHA